jgi:hypothetical protein
MTKYVVTAVAYNKKTGKQMGSVRNETIDTEKNSLFKNANNSWDVKEIYLSFWNDLDKRSPEFVKVLNVEEKESKGSGLGLFR